VRLERVRQEVGDALALEWRSFLLRPPGSQRPLEQFRRYTESWRRPAEAEPGAGFRVWDDDTAPPSHSMPPAVAGKVAASFGADAFDRFHLALMRAYFAEHRTISERDVVLEVAAGVDLDPEEFAARLDAGGERLAAAVLADHRAALAEGIAAVPTVVVDDEYVLTGAMAAEQYLKVVARLGN
jgi:predicted DsbA family dithiol-disulfide isomerase